MLRKLREFVECTGTSKAYRDTYLRTPKSRYTGIPVVSRTPGISYFVVTCYFDYNMNSHDVQKTRSQLIWIYNVFNRVYVWFHTGFGLYFWECSGSMLVVECLTRDRGAAGSSLTITEKLLTGTYSFLTGFKSVCMIQHNKSCTEFIYLFFGTSKKFTLWSFSCPWASIKFCYFLTSDPALYMLG